MHIHRLTATKATLWFTVNGTQNDRQKAFQDVISSDNDISSAKKLRKSGNYVV